MSFSDVHVESWSELEIGTCNTATVIYKNPVEKDVMILVLLWQEKFKHLSSLELT